MWIFAYGSLMADGWEKPFGVKRREVARLLNYERSFTKASSVNWGTKLHPAPTLRIIDGYGASCFGIAFEFSDDRRDEVFGFLAKREGRNFTRIEVELVLHTGEPVSASTYRYDGDNLIDTSDLATLAQMAASARGTSGSGLEYIAQVKEALAVEVLRDPVVDAIGAAVGHQGKMIIRHEMLKVGDIVLTTTGELMSGAIRTWTKSDISHAMIYVDAASVIDATPEGVHARNTQRILFDEDRSVHVLRLTSDLPTGDAAAICEFVRQRVGTRYSKREAAGVVLGGGKAWKDRQFCSRLVAQAYASRGYYLVANPDYCSPDDILHAELLHEIEDCTRPATRADIDFAASADPTQGMRDATEKLLSGARVKDVTIADINGIVAHLMAKPGDDEYMHQVLRESGYLDLWMADVEANAWHYDFEAMDRLEVVDALKQYCLSTVEDSGAARHRFAQNAAEYAKLAHHYRLATFEEMAGLYTHLEGLHRKRRLASALWLDKHAPGEVPPRVIDPHTPEWFAELHAVDPAKAEFTGTILKLAGRDDACSICGDDPAPMYRLEGTYLPGEFVPTVRLCDDHLRIRASEGEIFVPLR